jgi:regulation of enolase protein 1 (concanavalin A-like superfamily)
MVYENPMAWAKFCLELSPQGLPTVVSVVTKGVSDDCNAFAVNGPVYLRISKLEQAYAFHVSQDGSNWNLIRYFKLDDNQNAQMVPGTITDRKRLHGPFEIFDFGERLLWEIFVSVE